MNQTARTWLVRAGSFLLAGLLLFLALRGVDFTAVGTALADANWWWLLPMAAAILLSHWLRAVRWRFLLVALLNAQPNALPNAFPNAHPAHDSASDRPVTDRLAFMATMIGYMANYAGPRLGELIRGGTVAARTSLSFPSVFGTIVAERILDTATLAVAMLSVPFIFGSEISRIQAMLWTPVQDLAAELSTGAWLLIGLAVVGAAAAGLWLLLPLLRADDRTDSEDGATPVERILNAFRAGFGTLARSGRPTAIVALTVVIWMLYGLVAWIPFIMLDLAAPYGIGPLEGWGLMLIGAIGILIPSPGGIGSYHYIMTESLEILYAMPQTTAATYALLVHTGQMLLYIAVGFASILILGRKISLRPDREPEPTTVQNP